MPIIAAMQGDGIGGGLMLGMFADFAIFGRECLYAVNFMKYGVPPSMGSTLILP